jgi:alpha-galactosidase
MSSKIFELNADGVSLIVDISTGTPAILHWGADIGFTNIGDDLALIARESSPHADLDEPQNPGIWRENARGFLGRPAIQGHRLGQDWSQLFAVKSHKQDGNALTVVSEDVKAGLEVSVRFEITPSGVVLISQDITNTGSVDYSLSELTTWLPLPDQATETMDFTGRWVLERQPQRRKIQSGTWAREIREGRSGHDYTIVQLALTEGANYQQGEVWSLGLMWSGNNRHLVEKMPTGKVCAYCNFDIYEEDKLRQVAG